MAANFKRDIKIQNESNPNKVSLNLDDEDLSKVDLSEASLKKMDPDALL